VEILCTGWRCGGVNVMPFLSDYACKVCLQVSPRFHYRRVAFCFLPLAAILEFLISNLSEKEQTEVRIERAFMASIVSAEKRYRLSNQYLMENRR
jgi:hypothetical protein